MKSNYQMHSQVNLPRNYGIINLGDGLSDTVLAITRITAIQSAVNGKSCDWAKMNVSLRVGTDYAKDALPASNIKDCVGAKFTLYSTADKTKMKQFYLPGILPVKKSGTDEIDTKATVMNVYDIAQAFVDNHVHHDDGVTEMNAILSASITRVRDVSKSDDLDSSRS